MKYGSDAVCSKQGLGKWAKNEDWPAQQHQIQALNM
jgi:hypothetical protein